MSTLLVILAEDTPKGEPGFVAFLPFVGMLLLLYFIVLRPMKNRQEQERQGRLAGLQKNDKVLTVAGIYGSVVDVSDKEDVITVKIDDNVRVKMTKGSVVQNISQEERIKAEKEKEKAQKAK
jgi:preprotein translocase subunit YajC